MKKALVTGSAGFVGRHFIEKLTKDKWEIDRIDILDPHNPMDARDFFRKDATHYDLVVHLAAVVGGRATIEGAPLSVAVDLAIDSEAFQWALRTKPKHFVYYSSSAAYPIWMQEEFNWMEFNDIPNKHKLKESDINLNEVDNPDLTYGWAKLTGEMLAGYAKKEGLNVHVFRPFSGYGPDQALDYPFPSFIKRAKDRMNPFEIWGDGKQTRDWIHINDIVEATLKAVEYNVEEPVNLCSGIPVSFNRLAEAVTFTAGYSPKIQHRLDAPKGVHYRVGDPTKLNSFYVPKISLDEGIWRALNN